MALKWVEGFETYSDLVTQLSNRYALVTAPNVSFTTGRAVGNGLNMNGTIIATPSLGNQAVWYVGIAFKNVNLSTANINMPLIDFRDVAVSQVTINFNPSTKTFAVLRGATVLGTGTAVLTTGVWYYIEASVTINSAAGTATVKVNGVSDIALVAQNTQVSANAYANDIGFRGPTGTGVSGAFVIDDIYICDSTGGVNDTYLGDMKVEAINVIDAGNYAQWTANVLNEPHFQSVQVLNDGLYVQSNTGAQRESYLTSNLNRITGSIKGVSAVYWGKNSDSTQHIFTASTRISVTDYDSANVTLTDTATKAYQHIWETNPDSAIAWTVSDVNNAEFGITLVS